MKKTPSQKARDTRATIGMLLGFILGAFIAYQIQYDWGFQGKQIVGDGNKVILWTSAICGGGLLGVFVALFMIPTSKRRK